MRVSVGLAGLLLLAGCGSSLGELAKTQARFLTELERAMPPALDAQDAALRRLMIIADRAEEQSLRDQWAAEIAGVTDAAIAGAHLDLQNPSREAVAAALGHLTTYRKDRQQVLEAAHEARDKKVTALLDAMATLKVSASTLAANERALAQYLEAQRGMLPVEGFAIGEPVENIADLLSRLKALGHTLDVQFDRARALVEAATKAVHGE